MKNLLLFCLSFTFAMAQNGVIKGTVVDELSNENLFMVDVFVEGKENKWTSDESGNFEITGLETGLYNIKFYTFGYEPKTLFEIRVTQNKPTILEIKLKSSLEENLEEFVVETATFDKKPESNVSVRTIGIAEIERNPGANRDISKVIQSLPGVGATSGFRNDILIRGGGPNENRFYLDGIEVPNINHFATQGASGGPVGLLNVNFIENVDFYSSAFPAARGNALSSVLEFKQKEGNKEKLGGSFIVGSNDFGITLDGPVGDKTTFIASARYSYLQLLFSALKLPFLPTYFDAQFKVKTELNKKNQLTLIGLGAIDNFKLNEKVNDGEEDPEVIRRNNYTLDNIPVNSQWNYTVGAKYTHFNKKSYFNIIASRSMLNNEAFKFLNNDDSDPNNQILDYKSQEVENKLRLENVNNIGKFRVTYGAGYELARYTNLTKNRFFTNQGFFNNVYESKLLVNKGSLFGSFTTDVAKKLITITGGIRTDFNDYNANMKNPLNQISPRLGLSFNLSDRWSVNLNSGIYYQTPAYTVLGFKTDSTGFDNRTRAKFTKSTHFVAGVEYLAKFNAKFSVEGFYKLYDNYPLMLDQNVSLANLGANFGVVGNGSALFNSKGRAYGLEFLYQQKVFKGFFGILAYTLAWSEFTNGDDTFTPSAWDARHTISFTMGKKFKKGWEMGLKWRFSTGNPYTPYDVATSALKNVWDLNNSGIVDYNQTNTERLSAFHFLDIRIDKKWSWKKLNLNLYLDLQNIYNFKAEAPAYVDVVRDDQGNILTDPNDASRYQVENIENFSGTLLPTIGIIVEW